MTSELASILGVTVEALPGIFSGRVPMPLKIGTHDDLLARYPQADIKGVRLWLGRWTGTEQYLRAVVAGGSRYDLDGASCGEIAEKDAARARDRLDRAKKEPATG